MAAAIGEMSAGMILNITADSTERRPTAGARSPEPDTKQVADEPFPGNKRYVSQFSSFFFQFSVCSSLDNDGEFVHSRDALSSVTTARRRRAKCWSAVDTLVAWPTLPLRMRRTLATAWMLRDRRDGMYNVFAKE